MKKRTLAILLSLFALAGFADDRVMTVGADDLRGGMNVVTNVDLSDVLTPETLDAKADAASFEWTDGSTVTGVTYAAKAIRSRTLKEGTNELFASGMLVTVTNGAVLTETNYLCTVKAVEEMVANVRLPAYWALDNVTNATGGTVGAVDVGAIPATQSVSTYGTTYYTLSGNNAVTLTRNVGSGYGTRMLELLPTGFFVYRNWDSPYTSAQVTSVQPGYITLLKGGLEYRMDLPETNGTLVVREEVPTNLNQLVNGPGYITSETEFTTWKDGGTDGSLSAGRGAFANYNYGTAYGVGATASMISSTAVGGLSKADGALAVAVGKEARASQLGNVAVGGNAQATAASGYAVAVGSSAKATGYQSFAMGYGAKAQHSQSVVIGLGYSKGDKTVAFPTVTPSLDSVYLGDTNLGTLVAMKIPKASDPTKLWNVGNDQYVDGDLNLYQVFKTAWTNDIAYSAGDVTLPAGTVFTQTAYWKGDAATDPEGSCDCAKWEATVSGAKWTFESWLDGNYYIYNLYRNGEAAFLGYHQTESVSSKSILLGRSRITMYWYDVANPVTNLVDRLARYSAMTNADTVLQNSIDTKTSQANLKSTIGTAGIGTLGLVKIYTDDPDYSDNVGVITKGVWNLIVYPDVQTWVLNQVKDVRKLPQHVTVLTNGNLQTINGTRINTVDYPALTNAVNTVNTMKDLHYDPTLNVTWTNVVDNGHIYYVTVTNTNVSTL